MILIRRLTFVIAAVAVIAHAAPASGRQAAATPEPAAKVDVVCVAIVLPTIEGAPGDSATLAESVRAVFTSYLTGPSLKALPLEARLPSQAAEEARQKDCGRVLTVALVLKRGGGGNALGAITRAAGTAAWYVPVSGVGGAIARGSAVAGAEAVAAAATGTRAKDEMRIDYRVTSPDGAAILAPKFDKAKAKADGEDIVTPLVAKAAAAVAAAVAGK